MRGSSHGVTVGCVGMVARAETFAAALERVWAVQARERADPRVNPDCQSVLLHHGEKTPRAIVFLHGITSSPVQFHECAKFFHARGYNVCIARMPLHGHRNRLNTEHGTLTADQYKYYAERAVESARGLGEHLTLAGLSVSGVAAAWGAQTLVDVNLGVLIAPAFAPPGVPSKLLPMVIRVIRALPNLFLWWDFKKRARIGPTCSYPRFSTHALAECYKLGREISHLAADGPPAGRAILAVTNRLDMAVNNAVTADLLRAWRKHPSTHVREYQFGRELGRQHDIIGPYQPDARIDLVYPILFDLIDARA